MSKCPWIGTILVALVAPLVMAQAPARQKVVQRQALRPTKTVTVFDLRNVTGEKKPPKRLAEPRYLPRMSAPKTAQRVAGLPLAELSEALKGAGISVPPPDVYARFMPGQTNIPGKGFLYFASPDWAYPDHVDFHSSYEGMAPWIWNGPMVVLREPGTYVLDFLVELTGTPAGARYGCDVLIGYEAIQMQALQPAGGPQHVLVVWNLDPATAGLGDENKSVGLHCYLTNAGENAASWTFYLVDITRL